MPERRSESRFKVKSDADRRIGIRVLYIRRVDALSQSSLADMLGLTRSQLANVESGRVALRLVHGWRLCCKFLVQPLWLATGQGSIPLDYRTDLELKSAQAFVDANKLAPFQSTFEELQAAAGIQHSKTLSQVPLDKKIGIEDNTDVQNKFRTWDELVAHLKKITKTPGAKSELARRFNVSRQAVSQWLSRESKPSADIAIELQHWKPQPKK